MICVHVNPYMRIIYVCECYLYACYERRFRTKMNFKPKERVFLVNWTYQRSQLTFLFGLPVGNWEYRQMMTGTRLGIMQGRETTMEDD